MFYREGVYALDAWHSGMAGCLGDESAVVIAHESRVGID
jgi:hypothetical protein